MLELGRAKLITNREVRWRQGEGERERVGQIRVRVVGSLEVAQGELALKESLCLSDTMSIVPSEQTQRALSIGIGSVLLAWSFRTS